MGPLNPSCWIEQRPRPRQRPATTLIVELEWHRALTAKSGQLLPVGRPYEANGMAATTCACVAQKQL